MSTAETSPIKRKKNSFMQPTLSQAKKEANVPPKKEFLKSPKSKKLIRAE